MPFALKCLERVDVLSVDSRPRGCTVARDGGQRARRNISTHVGLPGERRPPTKGRSWRTLWSSKLRRCPWFRESKDPWMSRSSPGPYTGREAPRLERGRGPPGSGRDRHGDGVPHAEGLRHHEGEAQLRNRGRRSTAGPSRVGGGETPRRARDRIRGIGRGARPCSEASRGVPARMGLRLPSRRRSRAPPKRPSGADYSVTSGVHDRACIGVSRGAGSPSGEASRALPFLVGR